MLNFFPQKGKDYSKLPKKALAEFAEKEFLVSTKYDGNMVFIVVTNNHVRWFTSDWHEFKNDFLADRLIGKNINGIIKAEYMHNCIGKLGSRGLSAKITTFRTNFSKGLPNSQADEAGGNLRIFDFLPYTSIGTLMLDLRYETRLQIITALTENTNAIKAVKPERMTGAEAMKKRDEVVANGWEGVVAADPDAYYQIPKSKSTRVNYVVKLKNRPTADLRCIGVELSDEGQFIGEIGSLILTDKLGRIVNVGSGLNASDRAKDHDEFITKIIEISYEQIKDTYIQPVFVAVRYDKHESD